MPTPDRKPDAVIVGRPYLPAGGDLPHARLSREFGPLLDLGPRRLLYVRAQKDQYFCTGNPDDTIEYPAGHPLAPQERYEWHVVNDGGGADLASPRKVGSWLASPGSVKFGWLKPDPYAVAPGEAGPTAEELADARLKRFGGGPAYPPGHPATLGVSDDAATGGGKAAGAEAADANGGPETEAKLV